MKEKVKHEKRDVNANVHRIFDEMIRIHQTLHTTPAMAAGVTDHLWEMANLVELIESRECEAALAATF